MNVWGRSLGRLAMLGGLMAASALGMHGAAHAAPPLEMTNAALWQQRSVEYDTLARQTYRQATAAFDQALATCDRKHLKGCEPVAMEQIGIKPSALARMRPAVIVDLDETVLDNSRFQGEMQRLGDDYTEALWDRWVNASGEPDAEKKFGRLFVPGAIEFLQHVGTHADVFFVSNRECPPGTPQDPKTCDTLRATMALLAAHKVPRANDPAAYYFKTRGVRGEKTGRRMEIAELPRRIVLLVGDDLGDFISRPDRDLLRAHQQPAQARHMETQWGRRWFVLPNAMYGSWDDWETKAAAATCGKDTTDLAVRQACRMAKANAKDAALQGFQAPALRVATWNLGWHVSQAEVPAWAAVCDQFFKETSKDRWQPVPASTDGAVQGWSIKGSRPVIEGNDLSVMPPCTAYRDARSQGVSVTAAAYAARDRQLAGVLRNLQADVIAFQEVSGAAAVTEALGSEAPNYNVCSFDPKYKVQRLAFAWRKTLGEAASPCEDLPALSLPGAAPELQLRPGFSVVLNIAGKKVRFLTVHPKSSCVSPLEARGKLDAGVKPDDACSMLQQQVRPLETIWETLGQGVDHFVVLGDFNRNLWHEANAATGEAVRSDGATDLTTPLPSGVQTRNLLREVNDGAPANSKAELLAARCPGSTEVQQLCETSKHAVLSWADTSRLGAADALGCRNPVGLDQVLVSTSLKAAVRDISKVPLGKLGGSMKASPPQYPEPLLAVSDHCPTVLDLGVQ